MSPQKRKILFIQTQAENAGAQEISRLVGNGLKTRGHEVHHLFFYKKSETFEDCENQIIVSKGRPSNPWTFLRFLFDFVKSIRSVNPDVVFTFQHFGNVVGGPAARLARVKKVIANQVSAREVIHPVLRHLDHLFGAAGLYHKITVNSYDLERDYAKNIRAYTKRLVRIPHGFDPKSSTLSKSEARQALNLPLQDPLFGSVARLNATKQLDRAIKILPLRPGLHLAIAGEGPERQNLEALSQTLKVQDRVHFIGEIGPKEIGDFLKALDIFFFPSRAETFGLAAVEAASAGVPVLCNDMPVMREVLTLEGEEAALFVNVDNEQKTLEALDLLMNDEAVRAALLKASKKLEERYSRKSMIERYEALSNENTLFDLKIQDPKTKIAGGSS